jgi:hypothetical protein
MNENETQTERYADMHEIADYLNGFVVGPELSRLQNLAELRELVARSIAFEVEAARGAGRSWQAIADALGVTKQAAQQRYLIGNGR